RAPFDRLSRAGAAFRGARPGCRPRGPARSSGRSPSPDALSGSPALRRACAPRLRRLCRGAARGAARRRLPAVRLRGGGARRGAPPRGGARVPARRGARAAAPGGGGCLRPCRACGDPARRARARAARPAVGLAHGAPGAPRGVERAPFRRSAAPDPLAHRRGPDRVRLVAAYNSPPFMASDPKARIEQALRHALQREAPEHADVAIVLERPKQASHGDFSSNLALQLSKPLRKNPRELAGSLAEALVAASPAILELVEPPEVAGPGFINFRLKAGAKHDIVRRV